MNSYRQSIDLASKEINGVIRLEDMAGIPFDPANSDYQLFKLNVTNGAELQDVAGNVMPQADADAFIATLP